MSSCAPVTRSMASMLDRECSSTANYAESRTTASGFTDVEHLKREFEDLKLQSLNLAAENYDCLQEEDDLHGDPDDVSRVRRAVDNARQSRQLKNDFARITRRMEMISNKLAEMPIRDPNEIMMDDIVSTLSTHTIKPNDSASVFKPSRTSTQLSSMNSFKFPRIHSEHDSIVGGYEMSPEDKLEENDAITNIQTVYGLPRIFIDNRLNFLVHLHKTLELMLTKNENGKKQYPDPNSLEQLTRFLSKMRGKNRTPECELLYQVLRATLDTKRMRIKANPFNLPIIEVGMSLDDQLVFMCISELYAEYRTAWFNSMKNITPPSFSTEYANVNIQSKSVRSPQRGNVKRHRSSSSTVSFSSFLSPRT